VLRLYEKLAPIVAFSSGTDMLNIEVPTATGIVAFAVSPYISVAITNILEGITFAGAVPISCIVRLLNTNHGGVCTFIEEISGAFAGRPSIWRLFESPLKLTFVPAVVFMNMSALLKANKCTPTSM
jgi:hypothetical protein